MVTWKGCLPKNNPPWLEQSPTLEVPSSIKEGVFHCHVWLPDGNGDVLAVLVVDLICWSGIQGDIHWPVKLARLNWTWWFYWKYNEIPNYNYIQFGSQHLGFTNKHLGFTNKMMCKHMLWVLSWIRDKCQEYDRWACSNCKIWVGSMFISCFSTENSVNSQHRDLDGFGWY